MSMQICKFCNLEFEFPIKVKPDEEPVMVRSVKTGEYICMKCFRERIQP